MTGIAETLTGRLMRRVERQPDGCWNWTGHVDAAGYGHTGSALAHRATYERFVGPIPEGLTLDHLCRNRRCVNPEHLEAVTMRENARRGQKAQQTHCANDHEFTAVNTYIRSNGTRQCRACKRDRSKKEAVKTS